MTTPIRKSTYDASVARLRKQFTDPREARIAVEAFSEGWEVLPDNHPIFGPTTENPAYDSAVRDLARTYAATMPYEKAILRAKVVIAQEQGLLPEFTERDVEVMSSEDMKAYVAEFGVEAFPAEAQAPDPFSYESVNAAAADQALAMGIDEEYLAMTDEEKSAFNANAAKAKSLLKQMRAVREEDVRKEQERNQNLSPADIEAIVPSLATRVARSAPPELREHLTRELAASTAGDK
jgi:hypothetical protein